MEPTMDGQPAHGARGNAAEADPEGDQCGNSSGGPRNSLDRGDMAIWSGLFTGAEVVATKARPGPTLIQEPVLPSMASSSGRPGPPSTPPARPQPSPTSHDVHRPPGPPHPGQSHPKGCRPAPPPGGRRRGWFGSFVGAIRSPMCGRLACGKWAARAARLGGAG